MTFSKEFDSQDFEPLQPRLILVTGPARSGKSEWAEHLVAELAATSGWTVTYVATAHIALDDPDWQARIQQHQQRRPADWQTLVVPTDLAAAIQQVEGCLLIDSLGSWLANLLAQDDATWAETTTALLLSFSQSKAQIVLVAEETGWGVVPAYATGRSFRDRLGKLTRQIGERADAVYLVTGGYALNLSQLGTSLSVISQAVVSQADVPG